MANLQKFIDLFVRNFQPEPKYCNEDCIIWSNDDGDFVLIYFGKSMVYTDGKITGRFDFDGNGESIPEELSDMIFFVNGFIKNRNP